MLVDSHTHLYSEDFDDDLEIVMNNALEAGVTKFFLPAIDSSTHKKMVALEERYPKKCFAMMGLHPCSVKENSEEELIIVKEYLDSKDFAAVGEIGLDFYWDKIFIQQQYAAFEKQMQWALDKNLPIVIHSRNSMTETIEFVRPFADKGLRGIFHCFGGSDKEAHEIISMNFLLGIGGVLTYKNSGLASVLKKIPLEHLVLETDAPYLAPVPFRGKRNESAYVKIVAEALAAIKDLSLEEVAAVTSKNALQLFK